MTVPRDKRGRFLPRGNTPRQRAPKPLARALTDQTGRGTQEALAQAIWEFVLNGEVTLNGHTLRAENSREWAAVIKLLYTYLATPAPAQPADESEVVVRVVREPDEDSR